MEILSKIEKLNFTSENSAILCVDCQNGFTLRCPKELPVDGTNEIWIKSINDFLESAKKSGYLIITSKDDHPENHSSFQTWPPHCVKGTYGNKLFIKTYDFIVKKGITKNTDSYSAFFEDFKSKNDNGLEEYLNKNKIKKLIIFGLAGDVCVLETIKTAINKEFDILVINDFIKSVNKKSMKDILKSEKLNDKVKII
ncbi:isochorismatase family protein [Marinitoga sp. 1197]|uniref:isochorismatase family protein n=1 Tax=Marinitoga sp. 1197 TaxID=1428449 RepID=UPI0006413069|nr:isochorismatase family protein [Marinitoga sp. 1197]